MTIGWSIVGIGHFADHAIGPAMGRAADTKLTAVCSRSMERARIFSEKHGAQRAYDSFEKMLKDPEVDAVYIAAPNHLHAPLTVQAAEAGKHVLCEKPMAVTVAEGERMIEACEKHGVKLGVGYPNRYHPAHIEANRWIDSGRLGEITLVRAQFCRGFSRGMWKGWKNDPALAGSGALAGQAIHPIDLLRFLLKSEVKEVRALTDEELPHRPVDDMVYAILRFENGVDAVVISGMLAPRSDDEVTLYGTQAKLACKDTFFAGETTMGELLVKGDTLQAKMSFSNDHPTQARSAWVIEAFNKCIQENAALSISGYNGLQMIKVATAILESSRQGKAVRIR
jgi:predicted dehydrogenase